jgi:hypothetical protein
LKDCGGALRIIGMTFSSPTMQSSIETTVPLEPAMPTRAQACWFAIRVAALRLRRWIIDPAGARPRRLPREVLDVTTPIVSESRTLLFPSTKGVEFALQAGKTQNLRMAARALNGTVLEAGELFSFWAHVPRPVRRNGFAQGRELREGCVIPSVGGGLCQLSNALYDAALNAGCQIVERHAHTQRVPGSQAATGRDATIFWNYVDLRFRSPYTAQLEVRLNSSELIVRLRRLAGAAAPGSSAGTLDDPLSDAESCETCGVVSCFRNPAATSLPQAAHAAWLVDAWMPEHDAYLRTQRAEKDWLFTPLDSRRRRLGPYRSSSNGFARVSETPLFVLERSLRSRRLASQGAARQRALLAMDEKLAALYARRLPPEATHLVVAQNLLPHLWRSGTLGGRTFDVLMTRLPIAELEAALDRAAAAHPESPTLADFRAAPELAAAETAALAAADHWITPHRAIAALAESRAILLDWQLPPPTPAQRGEWIVFPASTLGRKGAHELREAAQTLDLSLRLGGPVVESADFWQGVRTERAGEDWLKGARAVVLPAWVEHQPRRLLAAITAGIPVITTDACGLGTMPGVTTVPSGDVDALVAALRAVPNLQ